MRLQCTIAAAVLALTVGAANASTFNVDGSFASCTSSFYPTLQSVIAHTPIVSVCAPISLSGSLTINGGVLTALDLTTTQSDHFSALFLSQISNVNGNNWHLQTSWNAGGVSGATLLLDNAAGLLVGSMSYFEQPGLPGNEATTRDYSLLSGTATLTIETPLPGALPFFATGLGALGLLAWRRKRKGQG